MEPVFLLIASLTLLLAVRLVFFRGGFWRAEEELEFDRPQPEDWPGVVALVASHNDEAVIGEAVTSLLTQRYPGSFHVVLVDADSGDHTMREAIRAAKEAGAMERLILLRGTRTPVDWTQDAWAHHQGWQLARDRLPGARYLWLAGSDIVPYQGLLKGLVAQAEDEGQDLVSLMPLLPCESLWERLLVPAFLFLFQGRHPLPWVADPKRPAAAAAEGCLLVRSETLVAAGGLAPRDSGLNEGTDLAQRVKAVGGQTWLGLGEEAVSLRQTRGLAALLDALPSALYAQPCQSKLQAIGTGLGLFLTFLSPPLLVLAACVMGLFLDIESFFGAFLALISGAGAWALLAVAAWPTVRLYRQAEWLTLLLPFAALIPAAMIFASAFKAGPPPRAAPARRNRRVEA